jgi:aspartate-semialdehyde dehydrogenase
MAVRAGVLGATGAVGQRLVRLLSDHDEFAVAAVTASPDSAGRPYREAVDWHLSGTVPEAVADLEVRETDAEAVPADLPMVFSSLPSGVAERVEPTLAARGQVVSSNSSNARLAEDVPLVIPEVNADHLGLIELQRDARDWAGALVKNPNCSTIAMAPTLAALAEFGLRRVRVATLQAVSGAGYDGVSAPQILDNVLPNIGGEEAKMETETRKLLGRFDGAGVDHHEVDVSASCNRVPTLDGHLESVWAATDETVSPAAAVEAFDSYPGIDLPSAPERPLATFEDPRRPQPRLDRDRDGGMRVSVGPPQSTTDGVQYDCLVHNTLRGAAGASLLNAELLLDRGYV